MIDVDFTTNFSYPAFSNTVLDSQGTDYFLTLHMFSDDRTHLDTSHERKKKEERENRFHLERQEHLNNKFNFKKNEKRTSEMFSLKKSQKFLR